VANDNSLNFALYSKHALAVTLLLYCDNELLKPIVSCRLDPLRNKSGPIWHCRVQLADAVGARYYAYQIDGPSDTVLKNLRVWQAWTDWLLAKLAAQPDIYLRELQAELKTERGVEVCLQTISNACQALERTRKKRRLSQPNRIGPMSSNGMRTGRNPKRK
jgi:pullulanase/glycogen debranching enzyme